jgi:hypothetical protein
LGMKCSVKMGRASLKIAGLIHTHYSPPLVRCVILGFFYTHRCVFMFRTPRRLSVDFRSQGGKIGEVSVQVCLSARHAIWRWVGERKDSWECPAQYEKQK